MNRNLPHSSFSHSHHAGFCVQCSQLGWLHIYSTRYTLSCALKHMDVLLACVRLCVICPSSAISPLAHAFRHMCLWILPSCVCVNEYPNKIRSGGVPHMRRVELWRLGATGSLATYGGATQKGCPLSDPILSCARF